MFPANVDLEAGGPSAEVIGEERKLVSFEDHLNRGCGIKLPSMIPKLSDNGRAASYFDPSRRHHQQQHHHYHSSEKVVELAHQQPPLDENENKERKRSSFVKKKFHDGPPQPIRTADGRIKKVQYNIISGI